jgi:SAM-dependent methyltransferase
MEPDWAELWREITARVRHPETQSPLEAARRRAAGSEHRARRFDAASKRKGAEHPDTLLDFVLQRLRPGHSVLDIGAGTGRFAIPFARVARSVTAVEPSPGMAALLEENAAAEGLANVRLVQAGWEQAKVELHDVAFCSHAMYSSLDLVAFVRKMEAHAREYCFLAMRMPSHDGVMRELSRRIHGQPYDSPNFLVGYHVLYDMGIYANVVVEPFLRGWTDTSLEEALQRARRHLRVGDNTAYDELIRETLARRLTFRDGCYRWPDGMRSAMAWWQPSRG